MARLSKPDIASRLGAGERHVCPECSLTYWWRQRLPAPHIVTVLFDGELVDDPMLFEDIAGDDFCSAECAERWVSRTRARVSPRYDFYIRPARPAP